MHCATGERLIGMPPPRLTVCPGAQQVKPLGRPDPLVMNRNASDRAKLTAKCFKLARVRTRAWFVAAASLRSRMRFPHQESGRRGGGSAGEDRRGRRSRGCGAAERVLRGGAHGQPLLPSPRRVPPEAGQCPTSAPRHARAPCATHTHTHTHMSLGHFLPRCVCCGCGFAPETVSLADAATTTEPTVSQPCAAVRSSVERMSDCAALWQANELAAGH